MATVAAGTVAAGQGRFELGESFGRQQIRLIIRNVVPWPLRYVMVAFLQRPDALLFQPHTSLIERTVQLNVLKRTMIGLLY